MVMEFITRTFLRSTPSFQVIIINSFLETYLSHFPDTRVARNLNPHLIAIFQQIPHQGVFFFF